MMAEAELKGLETQEEQSSNLLASEHQIQD